MRSIWKICFLFSLTFLFCAKTFADVRISEVMYDLPGSDSGREWIEVENLSGEAYSVDLKNFKLVENETNHGLIFAKGNLIIPARGFFVISNDPSKFLTDWPNFSGTIFKSNFSLNNSGENLALRISSTTLVSAISISTALGGTGDGNSIQYIDGVWKSSIPTPGNVNVLSLPLRVRTNTAPINLESKKVPETPAKKVEDVRDVVVKKEPLREVENPVNTIEPESDDVVDNFWLWSLGGIILLGILVILLPRKGSESVSVSEADQYTIID